MLNEKKPYSNRKIFDERYLEMKMAISTFSLTEIHSNRFVFQERKLHR